MTESELLESYGRLPPGSHPVKLPHGISHFDTLEFLRFEAQDLLRLLSNLADRNAESTELVTAKEKLSVLMQGWDTVLESVQQDRRELEGQIQSLKHKQESDRKTHVDVQSMLQEQVESARLKWEEKETALKKEIGAIKDHLEEGKEVWAVQMKLIEKSLKDQEVSKQKSETRYRDNMSEVERELDELVHEYKIRKRRGKAYGSILPTLFTPEELDLEQKRTPGDGAPRLPDLSNQIPKLEETGAEEKWDINIDSEESSELSLGPLSQTARQLYTKLRELRTSVNRFKHEDVSDVSSQITSQSGLESLDKGFIASLPSGLKTITRSAGDFGTLIHDLNFDLAKAGMHKSFQVSDSPPRLRQLDRVLASVGVVFTRTKAEESAPGTEGVPLFPLPPLSTNFSHDRICMQHLPKEVISPGNRDVKLEDLLRLEESSLVKDVGKFGDTLELSEIPKQFQDEIKPICSFSGTDLKELIREANVTPEEVKGIQESDTPEQPSVIEHSSHDSRVGNDSLLDFLNEKGKVSEVVINPEEMKEAKDTPFDVSGMSDIILSDELFGKQELEEEPAVITTRRSGVPKLPLHLLKKHQESRPPDTPSIDLDSPIALLQGETPITPDQAPVSAKKFPAGIREPDLSINLSIQNEPHVSNVSESVNASIALKMNSFFDLAPPKPTLTPYTEEKLKEKQSSSRGKIVPLLPEPMEEQKALLIRRQKMNESGLAEEQVSIVLPRLNVTTDEGGYQSSQSKIGTSFDENPAFRPRAGPISMQRKLPVLPVKPEAAAPGKFPRGSLMLRGRPLQPIHPNRIGVSKPTSPSTIQPPLQMEISHPPESKIRSESPNLFNKFRIRRFKESERPALKLAQKLPSVLPQRPVTAIHHQM